MGKIVAGLVGGFIVAFFVSNITNLISSSSGFTAFAFLLAWGLSIYISIKSPFAGKAWRKLLITSGALSFCVPLASFLYSVQKTDGGEILGGLFATGLLSVVFFMLGIAFLVIGSLVGRNIPVEVSNNEKIGSN